MLDQLRFGENNMHGCEIMLKDIADSKRINTNIKATVAAELSQHALAVPGTPGPAIDSGMGGMSVDPEFTTPPPTVGLVDPFAEETSMQDVKVQTSEAASNSENKKLPLEVLEATIISSLFWPPFQVCTHPFVFSKHRLSMTYHLLKFQIGNSSLAV